MVENLSLVSCGSLKRFPHTFSTHTKKTTLRNHALFLYLGVNASSLTATFLQYMWKLLSNVIMIFCGIPRQSRHTVRPLVADAWPRTTASLETIQDFLIKLDIKPLMHLLKISILLLNNDILRLKIMNNLVKDCKIWTFKVFFQCLKLVESLQKKFLWIIFD